MNNIAINDMAVYVSTFMKEMVFYTIIELSSYLNDICLNYLSKLDLSVIIVYLNEILIHFNKQLTQFGKTVQTYYFMFIDVLHLLLPYIIVFMLILIRRDIMHLIKRDSIENDICANESEIENDICANESDKCNDNNNMECNGTDITEIIPQNTREALLFNNFLPNAKCYFLEKDPRLGYTGKIVRCKAYIQNREFIIIHGIIGKHSHLNGKKVLYSDCMNMPYSWYTHEGILTYDKITEDDIYSTKLVLVYKRKCQKDNYICSKHTNETVKKMVTPRRSDRLSKKERLDYKRLNSIGTTNI